MNAERPKVPDVHFSVVTVTNGEVNFTVFELK